MVPLWEHGTISTRGSQPEDLNQRISTSQLHQRHRAADHGERQPGPPLQHHPSFLANGCKGAVRLTATTEQQQQHCQQCCCGLSSVTPAGGPAPVGPVIHRAKTPSSTGRPAASRSLVSSASTGTGPRGVAHAPAPDRHAAGWAVKWLVPSRMTCSGGLPACGMCAGGKPWCVQVKSTGVCRSVARHVLKQGPGRAGRQATVSKREQGERALRPC